MYEGHFPYEVVFATSMTLQPDLDFHGKLPELCLRVFIRGIWCFEELCYRSYSCICAYQSLNCLTGLVVGVGHMNFQVIYSKEEVL